MAPDVQRGAEPLADTDLPDFVLTGAGCRYVRDPAERPSVAVVSAVEGLLEAEGDVADGEDLHRLYDSVDPDALDDMFRGGFTGNVSFTFNGCHVTVTSENEVLATQLSDPEEPTPE